MKSHHRISHKLLAAGALIAASLVSAGAVYGAPKGPHNLQTFLSPTGETPGAWGKAKFKFVHKFNRLTVELHGLGAGVYDVQVDGASVGSVSVAGSARGQHGVNRLVVDSRSAGSVLFDPRGKSMTVVNTGSSATELVSDHFPADKSEEMEKTEIEADFTNTGVQPDAAGQAEFKSFKGRSKFEVSVHGLAPGTYDIMVGGESKAQINVTSADAFEIEFDSLAGSDDGDAQGDGTGQGDDDNQGDNDAQGDDDQGGDGGDLLLTFDPRGLPVAISVGGVEVLLIDPFPAI